MYEVEAQESIMMLSTAIVEQACEDYICLSEQINRCADRGNVTELNKKLKEYNQLVKWFLSADFKCISNLDASVILAGLNRNIEERGNDT